MRVVVEYASEVTLLTLECGPVITPWHPVFLGGEWRFPASLPYVEGATARRVRTFVLERGATSVLIEGVPAVTLGHGLDDAVVSHEYYGTERVLGDLSKFPGWEDGLVVVTGTDKMMKPGPDGETMVVLGYVYT